MGNSQDLARERYIAESPSFEKAGGVVKRSLEDIVHRAGVNNANVKVRVKSIASFVKKLKKYPVDCWDKTTDKVGAQVVVQTLQDIERLQQILESSGSGLTHLSTKGSAEFLTDPRSLRYAGVHVQVVVPDCHTSDDLPIECEIQLRTQAQDVWASIEHGLVYKPLIKPSLEIERKIERLSVLVEMFDEEVDKAMHTILGDPRYDDALLLRAAENLYHGFASEPGLTELSFEVLSIISPAFVADDRVDYGVRLTEFAAEQHDLIDAMYSQYGSASSFAQNYAYFLFTQPESLIILERLFIRPMALQQAIQGSDIEVAVGNLAAAVGRPLG